MRVSPRASRLLFHGQPLPAGKDRGGPGGPALPLHVSPCRRGKHGLRSKLKASIVSPLSGPHRSGAFDPDSSQLRPAHSARDGSKKPPHSQRRPPTHVSPCRRGRPFEERDSPTSGEAGTKSLGPVSTTSHFRGFLVLLQEPFLARPRPTDKAGWHFLLPDTPNVSFCNTLGARHPHPTAPLVRPPVPSVTSFQGEFQRWGVFLVWLIFFVALLILCPPRTPRTSLSSSAPAGGYVRPEGPQHARRQGEQVLQVGNHNSSQEVVLQGPGRALPLYLERALRREEKNGRTQRIETGHPWSPPPPPNRPTRSARRAMGHPTFQKNLPFEGGLSPASVVVQADPVDFRRAGLAFLLSHHSPLEKASPGS